VEPGPYIQTVSGRRFNPLEPDPAEIDLGDIARALSNQCRFGGHARSYYSVAQHSCLVSDLVEEQGGDRAAALWALLHDASEAYTGDFPLPIKVNVPGLQAFDRDVELTVRRALKIDSFETWRWATVKKYDTIALHVEAFYLFNNPPAWVDTKIASLYDDYRPAKCWKPRKAERKFLAAYEELRHGSD
jgi:hypothetical protein